MHRWSGVLYLGQVHARTQLERRGDLQRRPRTDYAWTVRTGAPSDLHRTPDHVSCNGGCARARGWNHWDAVGAREHLDQTALRGKTHAAEISRSIHGVSTPCETPYSLYPLAVLFRSAFRSVRPEKSVAAFDGCGSHSPQSAGVTLALCEH